MYMSAHTAKCKNSWGREQWLEMWLSDLKLLHILQCLEEFVAAALFKCAWPCVRCLEGQRLGSLLFSLFVDEAATAGLRHFAEIYSQDLYWWGAKRPSYRKCIHQRVSSFCLLQSKPSAFNWREAAAYEWRSCLRGEKNRLCCVCVILCFGFICWLLLPYEMHGNGFWFTAGSCLLPLIGSKHEVVLQWDQCRFN